MKKTILFFVIAIFLVQTASAFTFLNIYLDEKGQATFLGETSDVPILPAGINIQGSTIVGKTQETTSKQGEIWTFSYALEGAEMNIILPKRAVIKSVSNGEISINNNQISISTASSANITYKLNEIIVEEETNPNSLLAGLVLGAILIVLIVFLINYSKREKEHEELKEKVEEKLIEITAKEAKKPDKLKTISKILNKREKSILSALKKSGKIKQSYLRRLSNIPKASFSRHIQELEKKKLIKRSGEGKNKFVELID